VRLGHIVSVHPAIRAAASCSRMCDKGGSVSTGLSQSVLTQCGLNGMIASGRTRASSVVMSRGKKKDQEERRAGHNVN
jgi:hypothetical protein